VCLAGFRLRDDKAPGYAIGGLARGESKDDFWKVVDHLIVPRIYLYNDHEFIFYECT
jgi:queuine/archaeosine tRNA-ribosyltransferase